MANKQEVINAVAEKAAITKKEAATALDAVLGVISETLIKGEEVKFTGFGKFVVRDRAERQGFNPQTKQPITIPATKAPVFVAGEGLKKAVK